MADKQTAIGWALEYIEQHNLEGFKMLVPRHVSPDDMSSGSTGISRPVRAIAHYWAAKKQSQAIVEYIELLDAAAAATAAAAPAAAILAQDAEEPAEARR